MCRAIAEDRNRAFDLTLKRNMVAVITNGTAVLGLGDIGAAAGMPVMEGKSMLFKEFGGVDSYPICIDSKDPEVLIATIAAIAPAFGGINLEDIAAPVCFEVEDRLKEMLDIPVFHDDQHGTAIVVLAALLNALKITGEQIEDLKVVVSGVGASGVACSKILMNAGVENIIGCDSQGAIYKGRTENMNFMKDWYAENTNPEGIRGGLTEAVAGANLFLGLSGPGTFSVEQLKTMATRPDRLRHGQPDAGDHARARRALRARDGHRPLGLPEPDQQRPGVPRHLPGRARLPRHGRSARA